MSKEEVAEIMNYCKENWNYYTARLEVLGISGWRLFGSKAAYVRKRISIVDFRRVLLGIIQRHGLLDGVLVDLRMAAFPSTGPRSLQFGTGAFNDKHPFELANSAEDGEEKPSLRCCRVKPWLFQRLYVRPGLVYLLHKVEEVLDGTAQSGELADDDGVSLPEGAKENGEFRAVLRRAGEFFLEDGVASVLFECIDLPVQVLVSGRAAGISDDHGNFVYLVSVSDFKIDFVSHITRYTKLRIRTDVVKNFLKKYVIRWFCIHHICTTLHNVYSVSHIFQ